MSLRKVLYFIRDAKILERIHVYRNALLPQKRNNHQALVRKFCVPSFAAVSFWNFSKKKEEIEPPVTAKEALIAKADLLFDVEKYKELNNLLANHKDDGDVEIMWRLSRAMYKMAETASEVEAKRIIYEAYEIILKALEINENHWAVHKWLAILLSVKSDYEGIQANIKESRNIKYHMLRAIELNPNDATILYMLGNWCYQVARLKWYQKKIVSVVFGEPPTSSFEEALMYFENAEKMDPKFYSQNLLMLAKTHLELNQKEQATKYLQMVLEYPARNNDDHSAKQEAQKIMKDI